MSDINFFPLSFFFLSTGFAVGFGHCIGMCGPIVVSLSLSLENRNRLLPHLLYNSGRILTYGFLGAILGLSGSFTGVVTHIAGIQKGVMVFTGLTIIAMGVIMAGWLPAGRFFKDAPPAGSFISRAFRRLTTARSTGIYFPLGLLLGLLPCGPVYTALLAVIRATLAIDNPIPAVLTGFGLMLAFGLGTVPALFLVGKLTDLGWLRYRSGIYKIGAMLMVCIGLYFTYTGFRY